MSRTLVLLHEYDYAATCAGSMIGLLFWFVVAKHGETSGMFLAKIFRARWVLAS